MMQKPSRIVNQGSESRGFNFSIYEYITPSDLAANFNGARREVARFHKPGHSNNLGGLTFDHFWNLYLGVGDGANDSLPPHARRQGVNS